MLKKKSFLERLTGNIRLEDEEEEFQDFSSLKIGKKNTNDSNPQVTIENEKDSSTEEAQLTVDLYQTPNEIVIQTMVAGVQPENLSINITRDMVTIKGRRDGNTQVNHDDYFYKELYWGTFTRTILLPHEVEIEEAEAVEKHGLLIIRLPKVDKARQTKLKVKSI